MNKIEKLYIDFKENNLNFQKKIWKIKFKNLIFIENKKSNFDKNKEIIPEKYDILNSDKDSFIKFKDKVEKGYYFYIYKKNDIYYCFAIEDYFLLSKEYNKVYIVILD